MRDDFVQRIQQLTPAQQAHLARRLGERAGPRQLVAFVVPDDQAEPFDADAVRAYVQERLPEYMVPAVVIPLDALPRTPNGKVDPRALPLTLSSGAAASGGTFEAPRTPVEETLANIWRAVLGTDQVGIHDNFFEMGGDSILSIHVVSRARREGLSLTADQLFDSPTIAELATAVAVPGELEAEQGTVMGALPLTPIQHWFFEQAFPEPGHWNHAIWIETPPEARPEWIEQAVRVVAAHHDALRLRFVKEGHRWRQFHGPLHTASSFHMVDLSAVPATEQAALRAHEVAQATGAFDLAVGPLFRAVWFSKGPGTPGQLLLVAHHLVVDLFSWHVLHDDLEAVYRQLQQGKPPRLSPKTHAFKQHAESLSALARQPNQQTELTYWLTQGVSTPLPAERKGPVTEASAETVETRLDAAQTEALIQVGSQGRVTVLEVLLAALVQTLVDWRGEDTQRIGLEGHGREGIAEDLDVSRTVGWFTTFYPVVFTVAPDASPGDALEAVKTSFRAVPSRGAGYGMMRYLGPDSTERSQLQRHAPPEVILNYGGASEVETGGLLQVAAAPLSPRSPQNARPALLEVDVHVAHGRLVVHWQFSHHVYQRDTISKIAATFRDALGMLIAVANATPEAAAPDFSAAGLSEEEFDQFLEGLG